MILPLFFRKLTTFFVVSMLVVPGFYTAIQTQKAMADAVPVIEVGPNLWEMIINTVSTLTNTAKNIISAAQNTITATKTTYLALKEAVLDPIARLLGVQLTNMLVNQMFSFVAKGNNGAPAFVTNPQGYFGSVAQESNRVFLTDLQNNTPQMLPSIRNVVRQRIIEENYVDSQRMTQSTFPGGDAGYQAYLQNPGACPTGNSWDCYFSTLEPQNNPYDVYQFESQRLAAKRSTDVKLSQDEILAASGYHSLKDCVEKDVDQNCTRYLTKTPGDALAGQVTLYLNNSLKNLQNIDEAGEVITLGISGIQGWMNGNGLTSVNEAGTQGTDQGNGVTTYPYQQ